MGWHPIITYPRFIPIQLIYTIVYELKYCTAISQTQTSLQSSPTLDYYSCSYSLLLRTQLRCGTERVTLIHKTALNSRLFVLLLRGGMVCNDLREESKRRQYWQNDSRWAIRDVCSQSMAVVSESLHRYWWAMHSNIDQLETSDVDYWSEIYIDSSTIPCAYH